MPIETALYPSQLDNTYPLVNDPVHRGDDHLRLIKTVLKTTFPNIAGAISLSHTEVNNIPNDITDVETDITDINNRLSSTLFAPSGTKLLFYQDTAPEGWTILSLGNTYTIINNPTDAGTTEGTDDPILNNKIPEHNHSFTTGESGAHTHPQIEGLVDGGGDIAVVWTYTPQGSNAGVNMPARSFTEAGAHTHTGTTDDNTSASNWAPRVAYIIIAEKD